MSEAIERHRRERVRGLLAAIDAALTEQLVERRCPRCGPRVSDSGARYCGSCGGLLDAAQPIAVKLSPLEALGMLLVSSVIEDHSIKLLHVDRDKSALANLLLGRLDSHHPQAHEVVCRAVDEYADRDREGR